MVHEDGLGEDLAEDHIQHGTAGEAQAQAQAHCAEFPQQIAQQGADDCWDTGQGCDQDGLPLGHAAADQGDGDGHALGDVVQADQHRKDQGGPAHLAAGACVGGADGHALGDVVQGDGAGHDGTGHEEGHFAVAAVVVFPEVVRVDQFVQIVVGLGVVGVDVGDLRIGPAVDDVVEQIDHCNADGDGDDDGEDAHLRLDSLDHQVEADHAEHHAAGEAQQQADGAVGILLQQRAHQTAQAGAHDACDEGRQDQGR